jgi:predicted DNA-binding transcriptional regulator AlpA
MSTNIQKVEAALLSAPVVADLLGCSVRHLYRMVDAGHFVRPISLGLKLKKFLRRDIELWLSERSTSPRL